MKNNIERRALPTRLLTIGALTLLLAGCADMAGVPPPQAKMRDAASLGLAGAAAQPAVSAEWWRTFGDPQLDALVDRALQDSPSLKLAQARLERARAMSEGAHAALLPKLGAELDLNRQLFSGNFIYPPPLGGAIYDSAQANLQGSWEIDFFGKNRAALDAALGNTRAAEADAQAARVLLASNVARGYLTPVLDRPNLTVRTGALATRVLLDGKRAIGVDCQVLGETLRIEAGTVILAGGTFNSPQLLLRSGIGAKDQLAPHGIKQCHDLPGVGQNLQDHPDVLSVYRSRRHDTMSLGAAYLPKAIRDAWQFARKRSGPLTSNAAEAGGFIKSRPDEPIPDLQLHLTAGLLDNHGLNWRFATGWGYSAHVCVLRPKSRGHVGLIDANPASPPLIDPNFLADPDDTQRLLRSAKAVRDTIMQQSVLAPWRGEEVFPGAGVHSDDAWRAYLRAKVETIYHPVGTCKMGADDAAVVDANLKVHGVDGLYVIDASIMPTLIGGNTNAPTVMIAEKAADGLLGA